MINLKKHKNILAESYMDPKHTSKGAGLKLEQNDLGDLSKHMQASE